MLSEDADYQRLLSTLHRADLLSRRAADQRLSRHVGVGRAMFLVLDLLSDAPAAVSQQAIADRLGLTKAAVSRQIAAAQDEGWLRAQRSTSSRRENSVVLTPQGRKLVARGRRHRVAAERQAAEALGVREMRAATRTLERLCSLLEQRMTVD